MSSIAISSLPFRVRVRRLAGAFAYSMALLPLAVVAAVRIATGHGDSVPALWQRAETRLLGVRPEPAAGAGRPGTALHAVSSALLGLIGLVELGVVALFVARGVLYGFVDRGPYDTSWGGPTLAGAWIVHFLIGLSGPVVASAVGYGVAELHRRTTAHLLQRRPVAAWVLPVQLVLCVATAAFVVAWTRQI